MTSTATTGPDLPGMTLVEPLGSGGFADVYLYERHHPKGRVAVKLLRSTDLDEAQRRQFVIEADTMAELAEHPYIVPVYGAGTTTDGRPYLVMAYYRDDLAKRLKDKPFTVAEALRYGIQLASAVETAHQSGIVHRDIKPNNVLVNSFGVIGLSDFGIASRNADVGPDDGVGVSLPWSPKEIVVGDSDGSTQSDVYSLAATVWHLLVGHAPFYQPGGDNSERATLSRIIHSRPPETRRPDVPASLDRLLQQALAKDPAQRPQTAIELARHFQKIEQELRLARTEIIVLEQLTSTATGAEDAVPLSPPSGSASVASWAPPTAPEPQVTARKAPKHIDAQPLIQSSVAPPGQEQVLPAASSAPTSVRPRTVDPGAPRTAPRSSTDGQERATRQRPRAIDQPVRTAIESDRRTPDPVHRAEPKERTRTGNRVLVGGAGLLLVLTVAVGFALSHRGNSASEDKVPNPPIDTSLPGLGANEPLLAPVGLHGTRQGNSVVFRWTAVAQARGYAWEYADGGTGDSTTTTQVVVASGQPVCIKVRAVSTAGAFGSWSSGVCGG